MTYGFEENPQWLCPAHGTYRAYTACPGCKTQDRDNEDRRITDVIKASRAIREGESKRAIRFDYAKIQDVLKEYVERQGIQVKRVGYFRDMDDRLIYEVIPE